VLMASSIVVVVAPVVVVVVGPVVVVVVLPRSQTSGEAQLIPVLLLVTGQVLRVSA
jgi:hypothetical protein